MKLLFDWVRAMALCLGVVSVGMALAHAFAPESVSSRATYARATIAAVTQRAAAATAEATVAALETMAAEAAGEAAP